MRLLNLLLLKPHLTRRLCSSFPTKLSYYRHRAALIGALRLSLPSLPPDPHRLLLSPSVAVEAFYGCPSSSAAHLLNLALHSSSFSHSHCSLLAFASRLPAWDLNFLLHPVSLSRFLPAKLYPSDLMSLHAAACQHHLVLDAYRQYRQCGGNVYSDESYNAAMRAYVELGEGAESARVFKTMVEEGGIPNTRTYTVMIENLVKCGEVERAMRVFEVLPRMRVKSGVGIYEALVDGCVGAGRFKDVKALIETMRSDGFLPTKALRSSLGRMPDGDEFIREMMGGDEEEEESEEPWLDATSLADVLESWSCDEVAAVEKENFRWSNRYVCKVLRNFKSAETVWKFFCWVGCQPGFTHDAYTIRRTITILAYHGHVVLVDKLLSRVRIEEMRLPFRTIKLIIDFCGPSKEAGAAVKIFRNYRDLCGPISDYNLMVLYSSLLRTLTMCMRNSHAMDVLAEMIGSGICPDIQTFTGLMHHYGKIGDFGTVQKLLAMVKKIGVEPDAYMYEVLIHVYCRWLGRAALGYRAFAELRNLSWLPDAATIELLVENLRKAYRYREADAVKKSHEKITDVRPLTLRDPKWPVSSAEMAWSLICPDIQTFSGLMHHYGRNGDIKNVQKIFAMVKKSGVQPDACMYKVLIQAFCKCENAALAYRAFVQMRNLKFQLDAATKRLLVESLWKEHKPREARAVEDSCEETSDVLPLTLRGYIGKLSSEHVWKAKYDSRENQEAYNSISITQPAGFVLSHHPLSGRNFIVQKMVEYGEGCLHLDVLYA